jgi:hypothetical protein
MRGWREGHLPESQRNTRGKPTGHDDDAVMIAAQLQSVVKLNGPLK